MTTNVLIVDSNQKRLLALSKLISKKRTFKIISTFKRGRDLINDLNHYSHDLIITADKLVDMTGYELVVDIMKKSPVAVIIFSDLKESDITVDYPKVLDFSIVDNIQIEFSNNKIYYGDRLIIRANILSKLNINKFRTQLFQINESLGKEKKRQLKRKKDKSKFDRKKQSKLRSKYGTKSKLNRSSISKYLVVIGASTGGPRLLVKLISDLPNRFPPVIIVQHMPKGFISSLVKRMDANSSIRVKEAEDNEMLHSSTVYLAPGGYHLELQQNSSYSIKIKLDDGPRVNFIKPSLDVTLFSAARVFDNRVVSVVLTGMGSDGREGNRVIKKTGGTVIALNEADSIVYGMNKSVIEAGLADIVCGFDDILPNLISTLNK